MDLDFAYDPCLKGRNPILWRFRSVDRFVKELHDGGLWFSLPSAFEDPWEASFTAGSEPVLDQYVSRITERAQKDGRTDAPSRDQLKESMLQYVKSCAVSCWYRGKHESAAMWDLYGKAPGVAIRTDVAGIRDALREAVADEEGDTIGIGRVRYLNYDSMKAVNLVLGDVTSLLYTKRPSFRHEREVRLTFRPRRLPPGAKGLLVRCDYRALITAVYVDPRSMPWVVRAVQHEMAEAGIDPKLVVQSDLLKPR